TLLTAGARHAASAAAGASATWRSNVRREIVTGRKTRQHNAARAILAPLHHVHALLKASLSRSGLRRRGVSGTRPHAWLFARPGPCALSLLHTRCVSRRAKTPKISIDRR